MQRKIQPSLIRFETLSAAQLRADRVWWKIYKETFPRTERETKAVVLLAAKHDLIVAMRATYKGKTIGIAVVHLLHHPPLVFLLYLAVTPSMREHHIGGGLFEHVFRAGVKHLEREHLHAKGLVWEVEIPALAASAQEAVVRQKRIAFYEKHRAVVLPMPYLLPPLHPHLKPMPLHLMYRAMRGHRRPSKKLQKKIVKDVYEEKYKKVNHVSKRLVSRMLKYRS